MWVMIDEFFLSFFGNTLFRREWTGEGVEIFKIICILGFHI